MEWRTLWPRGERNHIAGDRAALYRSLENTGRQRHRVSGLRTGTCCFAVLTLSFSLLFSAHAQAGILKTSDKLTDDEKIELLRNLMSEYVTMKVPLARSKKP